MTNEEIAELFAHACDLSVAAVAEFAGRMRCWTFNLPAWPPPYMTITPRPRHIKGQGSIMSQKIRGYRRRFLSSRKHRNPRVFLTDARTGKQVELTNVVSYRLGRQIRVCGG